jgi:hypothetical protein
MERYYGVLYKVYVGQVCMQHGPSPSRIARVADSYRKINPKSNITITALVRPDHLKEMNA